MKLDRRLLALIAPVRRTLILTIALGTLAGVLLILQAYTLSQAISRVFLGGDGLREVTPLLLALVGVAGLRAAALGLGEIAAQRFTGRIKTALRQEFLDHLLALGPAYTRGERTGELAATALQG